MRVKLFETIVSVSARGDGGNFKDLENQINSFLEQNPDVTVIDIKLTGSAAPVGDVVTNYGLSALLLYNESQMPPAI